MGSRWTGWSTSRRNSTKDAPTRASVAGGLRALEISLSTETNRRLDEIWPGPGGEAPQADAW